MDASTKAFHMPGCTFQSGQEGVENFKLLKSLEKCNISSGTQARDVD